jgi:hypothetical protein
MMKKLVLIIAGLCIAVMLQAQVIKNVTVTAGGLSAALTSSDKSTVTNLKVDGVIDARDFKTMRDYMPALTFLDLSNVTIAQYSGSEGTAYNGVDYFANTIPESAFEGKKVLNTFLPPLTITSIDKGAFSGCTGLSGNLNIPSSITTIGSSAFWDCTGYSGTLAIPSSVTTIGQSAFWGCAGLNGALTIPSSVTSIGEFAFNKCGFTSVTFPSSITSIERSVFQNCKDLTSISIPTSVISIGTAAFLGCLGLKSIVIPSSVTSIGNAAFNCCTGLISVTFYEGVTSIGSRAFGGCTGLSSISIPSTVTFIGSQAFPSNVQISFVSNNNFVFVEGVLFNKTQTKLLQCTDTKTESYIIPSSVDSIGEEAFSYCIGLTKITIPSSVTSIGNGAFNCCKGLVSITIPSSVTSIGSSAFSECTGLTSFSIPSTVTSIGNWAFFGCTGLTGDLSIPPLVTFIGERTFWGCKITSITIPSSVISIGNNAFSVELNTIYAYSSSPVDLSSSPYAFDYVDKKTCKLYVPAGSKSAYQAADQWKDFINIIEGQLPVNVVNEVDNRILTLYPNPANDYVICNLQDALHPAVIELYDLQGKKVLSETLTYNKQVSVSHLKRGIYFCKLKQNGNLYNSKIVIE